MPHRRGYGGTPRPPRRAAGAQSQSSKPVQAGSTVPVKFEPRSTLDSSSPHQRSTQLLPLASVGGSSGIEPVPASTGITGGPVSATHDLCLGVYAVTAGRPLLRTVMTSPTLNESSEYGADFVRGMRIVETNKIALHVSGTASIDEQGRTAHCGDFEAQADRMLVNIAALLEGQGARFADVVHAITYLKHPADAERIRDKLRRAGFVGFPHAMVAAGICRPDLLCETEALVVLPKSE